MVQTIPIAFVNSVHRVGLRVNALLPACCKRGSNSIPLKLGLFSHLTLNLAFYQPFVIHIPYIFNLKFLIFSEFDRKSTKNFWHSQMFSQKNLQIVPLGLRMCKFICYILITIRVTLFPCGINDTKIFYSCKLSKKWVLL